MMKLRFYAFACFILSGAASISYQLVWLRDALSHFGVITPVISVLLSVFMLGLMIGTYIAGKVAPHLSLSRTLLAYAAVELGIGLLALTVPAVFDAGFTFLLNYPSVESTQYLLLTSGMTALALLPPCVLIGATMPLMMKVLEKTASEGKNFGILYIANLTGALIGCTAPLILIELYGFQATLHVTVLLNMVVGCATLAMRHHIARTPAAFSEIAAQKSFASLPHLAAKFKIFLFLSGFAAIGGELLWIKAYTPVVGSSVYAFATVLGIYLLSNICGNYIYLKRPNFITLPQALLLFPISGLLVVALTSSPALSALMGLAVFGIAPLSFLFGYLPPRLIDDAAHGNPELAAKAYIYNFAGCVLGPLCIGYAIFPLIGLKLSLTVIALCMAAAVLPMATASSPGARRKHAAFLMILLVGVQLFPNYEDVARKTGQLHRDQISYAPPLATATTNI